MSAYRSMFRWFVGTGVLVLAGCGGGGGGGGGGGYPAGGVSSMSTGTGTSYAVASLVTDVNASSNPYRAVNTDPNLVNAWGLAFNPQGFVWVANNHTSTSTLYDGNGVPQTLVVTIPAGTAGSAKPTGIVFNGTQSFKVTQGGVSSASAFIFVGEAGTLAGWSPNVNMNTAVTVFDGAAASAVYKGLAIGSQGASNRLYAADFHNGSVDVFDANFAKVALAGGFADTALPAGYAPFGIQAIGNLIYVAYAKQDALRTVEVAGAGVGVVDAFDTAGNLVKRLIPAGGKLNAPWGMAMAPAAFGPFSNALLVANFGDGRINGFDPATGAFLGTLAKADGSPITIDGLWGIAFGNGINSQPTNTLFYTAGPASQSHGVYGRIDNR